MGLTVPRPRPRPLLCPGGETGRHARLKPWCSQGRAGSTPALDTMDEAKEKLAEVLTKLGATIVSSTYAPGIGAYYFNFKAPENALKEICRLALKHNLRAAVYLDGHDEVAYRLSIRHWEVERILCPTTPDAN